MTYIKKCMAVLVCIALLAVPLGIMASAEGGIYQAVITKQPLKRLAVISDETVTLEVQAQPPAAGGTLSYAWYKDKETQPIATGAQLRMPAADIMTPMPELDVYEQPGAMQDFTIHVVVTNTITFDDGRVKTTTVKSSYTDLTIIYPVQQYFADVWAYLQANRGTFGAVGVLLLNTPMFLFFILPRYAIYYIYAAIY